MDQVSLRARTGRTPGSRSSRRLRREGQVPAVVYGHDLEPINVAVDARELSLALHTELGSNAIINLEVEGGEKILTLARVITRHPYRTDYQHIDFVKVSLTETVTTDVAIHFEGEAAGAKEGGVFSPRRTHVQIEALVTQIPGFIELDISGVEIGESLRIEDLPVVEGVTYLEDADAVVMSITHPAAEIEEPVAEEEEGVEGEEAEEGEEGVEGESSEAGQAGEGGEDGTDSE
ncbi:MAG: 50S ribosomal protein L25 [Acidimicrobiia bacterium]